jgi:acid stress-induced BolA-like protein IbaG/YrbA
MDPKEIEELIHRNLPAARVAVRTDGMGHYEAVVVSSEFAGKRSLARHQLVYGALGEIVGREIHALALRTFTPEEWQTAESVSE